MSGSLGGVRVLVMRPERQASMLTERLRAEGALPLPIPAIKILPPADWTLIDRAISRLREFDWIVFTSVNGVDNFFSRTVPGVGFPERVGAIGPGSKEALLAMGVTVDWIPTTFTSAALADELPGPPARVLLVRADIATTELEDTLRIRDFQVERVDAYRTESTNRAEIRAALGQVDAVALTSASIARSFAEAAQAMGPGGLPAIVSIGPATSAACTTAGVKVDLEATEHTIAGLVAAMVRGLANV